MNLASALPIKPWARFLGLAGLLPFAALAVGAWWLPPPRATMAHTALLHYGAVILTFVGALHWGVQLATSGRLSVAAMVWSVVPSLVAVAALQAQPDLAAMALALALLISWAVDAVLYAPHDFKHWFLPLRGVLSFGAACALIAGAFAPSATGGLR